MVGISALPLILLALAATGGSLSAEPQPERAAGHVSASPASPARANAQASYERAEKASTERRFAEALEAYRAAVAADPSAPFVPTARARADYLAAHAEGNFGPLARLEEARRDPRVSSDRAAIEALERDIEGFPEGRVRSATRLVAAEAWWHRLGEPRRAVGLLEHVLADPAADRLTRGLAIAELVTVHRELSDLDSARRVVEQYPDLAPNLRNEVLRLARRVRLRSASVAALAALALIGLGSLARVARTTPLHKLKSALVRPLAVAFALYLGSASAVLVRIYGGADPQPFLWLGLGVLGIDVIARSWRLGSTEQRPGARAARALACGVGVLAVAFLALDRTDAGYLESFGL